MADKEATVYIVDVGASMGKKNNGRQESDLDWAMRYVWDKITSTVATERKTATLGVIGLKSQGTSNELGEEESFANISVVQEISQILLPDLQRLYRLIKVSKTDNGDAISAIVIAIQMITKYCKKLKYKRKIVLVTNGLGYFDTDDTAEITKKIVEDNIELVVLGVDFDDPDYGYKEEKKDPKKKTNEAVLKSLADDCGGVIGTMTQAIEELGLPRLKSTRPVHSFKGDLTLGDPEKYATAMVIDVERYPRTMIRRPATASQFVQRSDLSHDPISTQSSATILPGADHGEVGAAASDPNGLTAVKSTRAYRVDDEDAPGGKRDVTLEELAKGYEYGRTAVHISESDQGVTKLETKAALEIVGFIPWDSYDRYMSMSVSSIVIAQKSNSKAIMGLSSLTHALFEVESFAVGRLVTKDGKEPVLVLLAPSIEVDYECLLDVQIPFAEDVRSYKFPPLDKVVTVSGKILKEHRYLPTDALASAMSDYVDKMDLSTFGTDEGGKPAEYMAMTDTYSPVLHRIDQAVRWRAVHPTEPIPPPYAILTKYSQQPEELQQKAKSSLAKLIAAADVKKVPPKVQGRRSRREESKTISGLVVPGLSSSISAENAIPEFKQMLDRAKVSDDILAAADDFAAVIETRVKDSFGDGAYARVLEEMRVLREELRELDEQGWWNDWVRRFKGKLLAGELGGERAELWYGVRKERLGLLGRAESELSKVMEEEVKSFLSPR